jgi:hypothetical protein
MKPKDEQLARLARLVGATAGEEIDCAELLHRVAPYLKALNGQAELTEHLLEVRQHLQICPECHEEFVALIKAEGLDPNAILPE